VDLSGIIATLGALPGDQVEQHLCGACSDLLSVSAAAVTVTAEDASAGLLCSSDATAAALEELQMTLGEGPSVDAQRFGLPVGEPDLADPRQPRWLSFDQSAAAEGVAAIFAFPLRVGALRVGVLTLYQRRSGALSEQQHACALVAADVLTQTILAIQAHAPPGVVADALRGITDQRVDVHQAAGMIAVRLGTSVADALVRLRAHAYGEGRPLAEIAQEVVAGGRFPE
jgi:hypothetical protein